jgi:predicted HicB family RNase H-like nuclease
MNKSDYITAVRRAAAAKSAKVRSAGRSVQVRVRADVLERCKDAASRVNASLVDWVSDALDAAAKQ